VGEGIPQRQLSVGDLQLGFEEGKPPFDMTGTLKAPEVKFPQLHPGSPAVLDLDRQLPSCAMV
jgi:hypothetical protein